MTVGIRLALAVLPLGATLLLPTAAFAAWPFDPGQVDVDVESSATCPASTISVVMRTERGRGRPGYTIYKDGDHHTDGRLAPNDTRTERIRIKPGTSAQINVRITGQGSATYRVVSFCRKGGHHSGHHGGHLPYTGPPADLMAKLATATGLVLTGAIVWWYSSIWPRRTPDVLLSPARVAPRRYPSLNL